MEDLDSSDSEDPPSPPPRRRKRDKREKATKLSELEDVESDDEHGGVGKRPVAVRAGPGGYDLSTEFGDDSNMPLEARPKEAPKEDTGSSAGGLMAAAMAMQKERETVEGEPKGRH